MLSETVQTSLIELLYSLNLTNDELITLNENVSLKYGYNKPYKDGGIIKYTEMNEYHIESLVEEVVEFIEEYNNIEVNDESYNIDYSNQIQLDGYTLVIKREGHNRLTKMFKEKMEDFGFFK
jgi:hypothetical protein